MQSFPNLTAIRLDVIQWSPQVVPNRTPRDRVNDILNLRSDIGQVSFRPLYDLDSL